MIFDKMENISDYFEELPLLRKVDEFIARFNNERLADGTYEIDGKSVFAMVQSYRTKQQTQEMMFEAHKKYIDLQYIVNGIEKFDGHDLIRWIWWRKNIRQAVILLFMRGMLCSILPLQRELFYCFTPKMHICPD